MRCFKGTYHKDYCLYTSVICSLIIVCTILDSKGRFLYEGIIYFQMENNTPIQIKNTVRGQYRLQQFIRTSFCINFI